MTHFQTNRTKASFPFSCSWPLEAAQAEMVKDPLGFKIQHFVNTVSAFPNMIYPDLSGHRPSTPAFACDKTLYCHEN